MLHLRLFGRPELVGEASGSVALWRPHIALLALLALASDKGAPRALLAGLLWPDSREDAARRALRQAIFQLRRQWGPLVVGEGETVRIAKSLRIDVHAFESRLDDGRPAEALECYRGPFLEGFSLRDSSAFDHWADGERARLAERAARACAQLTHRALEHGAWDAALRRADDWLAIMPLSEAAWKGRILARARAGDRAAALEDFELFRRRLAAELAVEPGPEICELVGRVRRGESGARAPAPASRAPSTPARDLPMLGREQEFARLGEHWREARGGCPQLVVVSGEPGIGKTRLCEEFVRVAALDGATVLRTRAYEIERGIPYGSLTGLLRCALDAPGLAAVDAAALGEISRVVPEVRRRFAAGVAAPSSDLQAGRVRLLEAWVAMVEAIAYETPLLLLIDDLPWADEATVTALHYLWRRTGGLPLLILATAREEDLADGVVARLLATAAREKPLQLHRVRLGPLEHAAIARLIELARDAPSAAELETPAAALERDSGGNPLYLLEMLNARREGKADLGAGDNLSGLIAERLERLPPVAHELLRGAAVLGRRFPLPLATSVVGLSSLDALNALEELLRRRLVQQVQYGYDFAHDLVREVVYTGMTGERRRALHERAFARLVPTDQDEAAGLELASTLALHASRAELRSEALHWLLAAAEHARRLFAGAEAEAYLADAAEAAQSRAEHRRVWEQRGDLHRARCHFAKAAMAFLQARQWTSAGSAERLRLRIKILDALLHCDALDREALEITLEPLLADAGTAGGSLHRDALMAAAHACLRTGNLAGALRHGEQAVEVARACDEPGALVRSLLLHARVLGNGGAPERAAALLEEAVHGARAHDLQVERCDAESDLALELYRRGEWEYARRLMTQVIQRGTQVGAVGAVAVASLNLGDVLLRQGQWDAARRALDRAEELADHYDFPHVAASVRLNRALLAWRRGDPEAAAVLAAAAAQHAMVAGFPMAATVAASLRVLALLETGVAADGLEPSLPGASLRGNHPPGTTDSEIIVIARARLHSARGDVAGAERVLREALGTTSDVYAAAMLKREFARLLPGQAEASRLAAEAADVLAALGVEQPV
jgi:DNA-binding SARP family transcriptional activator/tetratricopeptide (TPR) repeat protein